LWNSSLFGRRFLLISYLYWWYWYLLQTFLRLLFKELQPRCFISFHFIRGKIFCADLKSVISSDSNVYADNYWVIWDNGFIFTQDISPAIKCKLEQLLGIMNMYVGMHEQKGKNQGMKMSCLRTQNIHVLLL